MLEERVTDSPYSDRVDRKESIKKLMKELSKDAEIKRTQPSKESVASTESEKHKTTAEKTKHSALRLFRTPSLPRRLRFNRQHSDLTPKEKSSAAKSLFNDQEKRDKEALDAANVEIKNKTEVLIEYEQLIEELKQKSHELGILNSLNLELLKTKEVRIGELEKEIAEEMQANELLKSITEKSVEKVEGLEAEIKTIFRTHDNEIDFLIATNSDLERKCENFRNNNLLLMEEIQELKIERKTLDDETQKLRTKVQAKSSKLLELENEYKGHLVENMNLLAEIAEIKKHAEDDMVAYAEENRKLISDFEATKKEMSRIMSELTFLKDSNKGLQEELAGKDIEMDSLRDEVRVSFNDDLKSLSKKYEQQIATLKEMHSMKIQEIESVATLEKSQLVKDHTENVINLKKEYDSRLERNNEIIEEKIRISEVQFEQKLRSIETSAEQSVEQERQLWKSELDKCQKIAETEIMQCEFEKQDLKTLLSSANEMMKEKDDIIQELNNKLKQEIENINKIREDFETEVNDARKDCSRVMTEKYHYQITLNNTRSTVNILMERLKKSDTDVELLKDELKVLSESKSVLEAQNLELSAEVSLLKDDIEEYKTVLTALRNSSLALEREVKERDSVFEKFMATEEETLETVNKLFNDKLEENIGKYFEMYSDIKRRYEARETYICDMKSLLEEFANGIELARMELDLKDKQLLDLQQENKTIKLENMTYKFRCEQFEKYDSELIKPPNPTPEEKLLTEEDSMVSNALIANIISQLELEANEKSEKKCLMFSDEEKISAENSLLKEKLMEKTRQIEILQGMVKMENEHALENLELKQKLCEVTEKMNKETPGKYAEISNKRSASKRSKQIDQLKESNTQLKDKITQLQIVNKEQESKITELKEQVVNVTPRKMNISLSAANLSTPKTPKTPKSFCGKENQSPVVVSVGQNSPNPSAFRTRNN
ncbi:hypothetical protein HA402_014142 [Bradysia odoriphaga]|nr:hypothetical protein HA402_014142 [Bradysia odoriphaga]